MRYLSNSKWRQYDGTPMTLSDEEKGVLEHEATASEMLAVVLRIYDENHSRFVRDSKLLSPTETEAFLRLLSTLDNAGEVIALETGDYTLLLKLAGWTLPTSPIWKETPGVIAMLQKAAITAILPSGMAKKTVLEG